MHRPDQNLLLASLPHEEQRRLFPQLELVPLALADILHQAGDQQEYAYFPTNSVVSLIFVMGDGASTEISIVGREGLVGVSLFMGRSTPLGKVVVSSAGYAYRLRDSVLLQEFNRSPATQLLLLRYTQALLTQMAQTAVCNRHHTLEQQLCRRLLLTVDRLRSDKICLTHKMIADALGVRREGISEAAVRLQTARLISYRRGRINVLDPGGLKARSCECYQVVKDEFDRLLPDPATTTHISSRTLR
jgi:CRP-like cAMP-binding protein